MAFWEPRTEALTVRRILKVNHAGEFGAIRIYNAQLAVARRLYPDIVPALGSGPINLLSWAFSGDSR